MTFGGVEIMAARVIGTRAFRLRLSLNFFVCFFLFFQWRPAQLLPCDSSRPIEINCDVFNWPTQFNRNEFASRYNFHWQFIFGAMRWAHLNSLELCSYLMQWRGRIIVCVHELGRFCHRLVRPFAFELSIIWTK